MAQQCRGGLRRELQGSRRDCGARGGSSSGRSSSGGEWEMRRDRSSCGGSWGWSCCRRRNRQWQRWLWRWLRGCRCYSGSGSSSRLEQLIVCIRVQCVLLLQEARRRRRCRLRGSRKRERKRPLVAGTLDAGRCHGVACNRGRWGSGLRWLQLLRRRVFKSRRRCCCCSHKRCSRREGRDTRCDRRARSVCGMRSGVLRCGSHSAQLRSCCEERLGPWCLHRVCCGGSRRRQQRRRRRGRDLSQIDHILRCCCRDGRHGGRCSKCR